MYGPVHTVNMQRRTSAKSKSKRGAAQTNQQIVTVKVNTDSKKLKKDHDDLHRKMQKVQDVNEREERGVKRKEGRTLESNGDKRRKESTQVKDRQMLRATIKEYTDLLQSVPSKLRTPDVADIPEKLMNPTTHESVLELMDWLKKAMRTLRERKSKASTTTTKTKTEAKPSTTTTTTAGATPSASETKAAPKQQQ